MIVIITRQEMSFLWPVPPSSHRQLFRGLYMFCLSTRTQKAVSGSLGPFIYRHDFSSHSIFFLYLLIYLLLRCLSFVYTYLSRRKEKDWINQKLNANVL